MNKFTTYFNYILNLDNISNAYIVILIMLYYNNIILIILYYSND